mgnify:CR=1 FL=1
MQNKINPKLIGLLIKSVITILIIVVLYVMFQKVPEEQQTNLVPQSQIKDASYIFNVPNYDNILESEELKVEIDTKTLAFRVNDKRNNFIGFFNVFHNFNFFLNIFIIYLFASG